MTLLPAPLLRGLSVLAIGGALAVGHITFASAAPKPVQVASASSVLAKADVNSTGSISSAEVLGENCYVELVREKTASGRAITRRIHECD